MVKINLVHPMDAYWQPQLLTDVSARSQRSLVICVVLLVMNPET